MALHQYKFFSFEGGVGKMGHEVSKVIVTRTTKQKGGPGGPAGAAATSVSLKLSQNEPGNVTFAVWGKVVDEHGAAHVKKHNLLPLGTSHGLSLYLCDTGVTNPSRSDCCLAWCLLVLKPKESKEKDEAGGAADGAPASKKRRISTGNKMYEQVPVATHVWSFEAITFFLTSGCKNVKFTFQKPVLIANMDEPMERRLNRPLCRVPYDWSLVEKPQVTRPKQTKSFALS